MWLALKGTDREVNAVGAIRKCFDMNRYWALRIAAGREELWRCTVFHCEPHANLPHAQTGSRVIRETADAIAGKETYLRADCTGLWSIWLHSPDEVSIICETKHVGGAFLFLIRLSPPSNRPTCRAPFLIWGYFLPSTGRGRCFRNA